LGYEASLKTIIIVASYAPSLINFREALIRELLGRGYRVVACAPRDEDTEQRLKSMGVAMKRVTLGRTSLNPLSDIWYAVQLYMLFRRVRPAAVLAYTAKPVIWGSLAAALAGVRERHVIVTGLGLAFTKGGGRTSQFLNWVVKGLYRIAMSKCMRVAFQNPDDQAEFISLGLAERHRTFVVNGSGVDLERFAVAPVPPRVRFLLIARLLVAKGIREYALAASKLRNKWPDAQFRLIGWFDGNPASVTASEVEAWVAAGVIEYGGHVNDVRQELGECSVYVLPSSYREGTPRTVLEAMAVGRAIITTDAPGCRETVRDGWNGFLVPVRDVDALAAAMERFLENPALAVEMGARSRTLAESKYDAKSVAKSLADGMLL
jgi:glycosyltransferase involved in cell wall biosynthesis